MSNRPLISFVMPTYNRIEWVGEAIQSILMQTVKDIELIVVDDGSNDGTREFLTEWGSQFKNMRSIINPKNLGAGVSRNIGMEAAQADIIGVCDSDDIYADERASLILRHFELNPNSELVNFPYQSIDYFNKSLEDFPGEQFDYEYYAKTGRPNYFCNPSAAYKKKAAQEINGYGKENEKETDDNQFIRKWIQAGKKVDFQPGFIPCFHRTLPNSMMVKFRGWSPKWVEKQ